MPMYKHILIATDGSDLAQKAEAAALELAKALGARITAVTVTAPWEALSMAALADSGIANPVADYEEQMSAAAQRVLFGVGEAAKKTGVACATLHIKDMHPAEGILQAAKDCACDVIVMASHGRGPISRLLLGSQANKVVTLSTVPVLVCR